MSGATVLFVDDEEDVRDVFEALFEGAFTIVLAKDGFEALAYLAVHPVDVVVSDMRMEPMRGSEFLTRAAELSPTIPRILLTGYADHDDLATAVNGGRLFAYVQKPWDTDQLQLLLTKAAEHRALLRENARLVEALAAKAKRLEGDVEALVRKESKVLFEAHSPAMNAVFEQIEAVAVTEASVLITGETGAGKELVARAIHDRSPRQRGRFVAQNLAALPPELLTSELFGHVKGAFTGAQAARRGLFELADGGTLFLDEIGEAPLALQALLLRALETREIWPVGASEARRVDLRIVAATNRDLLAEAQAGRFRLDLFYRLAVAPILLPPLRARREEIRTLGARFLREASQRMGREAPRLSEAAWQALEAHPFPGNVRELGNVMERICIYFSGKTVGPEALMLAPTAPTAVASSPVPAREPALPEPPLSSRKMPRTEENVPTEIVLSLPADGTNFDDLEREILEQVLERSGGNQSRAARALGLSESTFRSRLKRLRP